MYNHCLPESCQKTIQRGRKEMKTTLLYICYDVSSLLEYNVDDFVKQLSKDNRIVNIEINPISCRGRLLILFKIFPIITNAMIFVIFFKFGDFWFLPVSNIFAQDYGRGCNKSSVMIFFSRLPNKILRSFTSVNIM